MSAASPQFQDKAADKAHEPSMEEILASIRRIIADDQAAKPVEAPEPDRAEADDILDLAEVAEAVSGPPPVSIVRPVETPAPRPAPLNLDEIAFEDVPVEPEIKRFEPPQPPPRAARPPEPEPPAQDRLVSPATDASVGSAFDLLAHTVLSNNARTLEDIVKEMLRPMLKAWLDDNLPVVVERLVRAEIERVSRGR